MSVFYMNEQMYRMKDNKKGQNKKINKFLPFVMYDLNNNNNNQQQQQQKKPKKNMFNNNNINQNFYTQQQ